MTQRILSIQNDQISHNIPNSKHLHDRPIKKNLDTVFQGTVASRVHQLQNHSGKITPESRQNERDPSHESSYSRFGRRLAKRFSQPAQRNAKPSEETENEVTHSYTGISISNTGIGKQHDLNIARNRQGLYDKKDKVETMAPKIGIQNDEPTSWIETYEIAPRNKGTTSLHPNADILLKAYNSTNNVPIVLPDLSIDEFRKLKNKEEVILRKRESDSSISTTSTIRRRSVRDLFAHHGIKRPPGLASSVKTHNTVGQNNQDSRKYCQQCSSTSKCDSIVCHNCKLHSDSHFLLTDNQISTIGPIKKTENNINCDQNRQRFDINSASFIRKSRRSRLSSIPPTDIPLQGNMKSDNNNNLSRKFSQNLNKHKSTIGISNQVKKNNSTSPAPFLSGTNVTKSVKKSPFFARESLGITLPDYGRPRVASKKISCGTLQLNSTSSQNLEHRHTPLRHCVSLSKTHQNQYQIDPKSEGPTKESYFQKNIADIKVNPRHESLECFPATLNPTRYVPNSKILSTQNEEAFEKSYVGIDHKKPSSLDANSFDGKQIDTSMTRDEIFSERNSSTQAKEIPAAYKATDGLGVLSRAKSVFARGGDRLARANSVSSADAGINDTNRKHVISSSRNNNDLDEKGPGLSSLLHSEMDLDFLSKSELGLSKVNPILGHQSKAPVGQEKSAKDDNESKKQRRLKIARKIRQSLPKSADQQKGSLGKQVSGYQSDDNLYLIGMTTSEPSKQLIAGRWVDLPPINYRDHPSLWERSPDASLTDIAAQEIKGVTVTLQLEGRDDMVFRAKPLEVDIRENI